MLNHQRNRQKKLAQSLNFNFRYNDNVLSLTISGFWDFHVSYILVISKLKILQTLSSLRLIFFFISNLTLEDVWIQNFMTNVMTDFPIFCGNIQEAAGSIDLYFTAYLLKVRLYLWSRYIFHSSFVTSELVTYMFIMT